MKDVKKEFKSYLYGIKKSAPVFFGFVPVAMAFAIMASGAGMHAVETVMMSAMVFAGASQIMAIGMLEAGAEIFSIIFTTLILNLRHIVMSTCVFKKAKIKNVFFKLIAAMVVTDEGFALVTTEKDEECDMPFLLGIITVTYFSWVGGTVIGVLASNILPKLVADSFGIAIYALFLALIVPDIKKSLRLFITVCLTAILNVVLNIFIGSSWAVIVSTLIGAGIGTFIVEDSVDAEAEGQ